MQACAAPLLAESPRVSAPVVSIVIPTYQGASTLGAAIDSVLGQSFTDFELIVVDDASPVDPRALVAARQADSRLRYARNSTNLGPQGNWNRALGLARGRYIKLLPHDDGLHADCLGRQIAILERDPALALTFCARDVIGPDGRVRLRARGWPGREAGTADRRTVLRACLRHGTNVIGEPGAVLFRRDLAERIGGFDGRHPYVIDLEYWLRLLVHGQGWYEPAALAQFRVWGGSWSVAIGTRQHRQFDALMDELLRAEPALASAGERRRGRVMSACNALARQVFYRLFV